MYNRFTKRLGATPFREGLHYGSVTFVFLKFPGVFRSMEYRDLRVSTQFFKRVFYKTLEVYLKRLIIKKRNENRYNHSQYDISDYHQHTFARSFLWLTL